MSDLGTIRLEDLLSRPPEYGANASAESPNGVDPRYLRITDIDDAGHLLFDDIKCIPRFIAAHYLLSENDIVIARTGNTVGKSYLHLENNGPLAFAGYLVRFRLDEQKADPRFVFQYLHSPTYWQWVGNTLRTGAQPNVNAAEYKQLPLPEFTLPHQRKIARILTTVDNLIDKTEALIAKYQAIKQGMMHDLFTRGVDARGHLRPPYEEAPELYKQSELGWIPKEWEVSQLRTFLSYISYGFTNPMPETEEGPWMVTAANVFGGSIQYGTCRHTSRHAFDNLLTKKSRPSVGDILLTKDGTLGRIAVVDREGICINQSVAVLRPNGTANADFLTLLLESPTYQQKMLDDAGGSTIKHIYITVVDKMLTAVPQAISEQQRIANIMLTLDRKLSDEMAQRDKLVETKTGLMQDLLTGKVRVKVDEAEEVGNNSEI